MKKPTKEDIAHYYIVNGVENELAHKLAQIEIEVRDLPHRDRTEEDYKLIREGARQQKRFLGYKD